MEAKAVHFANRIQDVSQFLDSLDMIALKPLEKPLRVAYHDACHLAHAQGITLAPRRLLRQIPGVDVLSNLCFGFRGPTNPSAQSVE